MPNVSFAVPFECVEFDSSRLDERRADKRLQQKETNDTIEKVKKKNEKRNEYINTSEKAEVFFLI